METKEETFLTSLKNKTGDLSYPLQDNINQLYSQLSSCIGDMDTKIQTIVQKHQADFLNIYKGHMLNVQKEMKDLRDRFSEQEVKRRRDQQLGILETQRDWFRNQALKLDRISKEYKKSMQMWKNKAITLQQDRKFMENKILKTKRVNNKLRETLQASQQREIIFDLPPALPPSSDLHIQCKRQIAQLKNENTVIKRELQTLRKNLNSFKFAKNNIILEKGELEDFFVECVEEVRKEIEKRRALSRRTLIPRSQSSSQLKRSPQGQPSVVTLSQFTQTDKQKVLSLFVQNEEVAYIIKNSIFPQKSADRSSLRSRDSQSTAMKSNYGLNSHVFSMPRYPEPRSIRPSTAPKIKLNGPRK